MITWVELLTAVALTVGGSVLVAAVMWRPLYGVLAFICGEAVAARFWTTFASVMLVIGPLFLVSFAAGNSAGLADFIRRAVYLLSAGLLGGFTIMGWAVMGSVRQHRAAAQPPRPAAPRNPWDRHPPEHGPSEQGPGHDEGDAPAASPGR